MLAAIWLVVTVVFVWPEGGDELPAALLGTWTTSDVRYADRSMSITDSTLTLLVGDDTRLTYPIRRVHHRPADGESRYDIVYTDAGGDLQIVIFYDPQGATLRLSNPAAVIWRRSTTPAGG